MCVCLAAWPLLLGVTPVVETALVEFKKLTQCNGVKLNPAVACSVEEAALAISDVVGHDECQICLADERGDCQICG